MSQQTQPGDGKKLLQAPCAEEYTASLKCKAFTAASAMPFNIATHAAVETLLDHTFVVH